MPVSRPLAIRFRRVFFSAKGVSARYTFGSVWRPLSTSVRFCGSAICYTWNMGRQDTSFDDWKEKHDRVGPPVSKRSRSRFKPCAECEAEGDHELKKDVVKGQCPMHRMRKNRAEQGDKHSPPKLKRKRTDQLATDFHTAWRAFHYLGVDMDDLDRLREIVSPYLEMLRTNAPAMTLELKFEQGIVATDDSDDQTPQCRKERKELLNLWHNVFNAFLDMGLKRDDLRKCRVIIKRYVIPLWPVLGYD